MTVQCCYLLAEECLVEFEAEAANNSVVSLTHRVVVVWLNSWQRVLAGEFCTAILGRRVDVDDVLAILMADSHCFDR